MTTVSTNPRGLLVGRFIKALAVARGDALAAAAYAAGQGWDRSTPAVVTALKAAVTAMQTDDDGALVTPIGVDFAELLRPQTLIGRMQGLRRVPFNTRLIVQTGGSAAAWVGEAAPKPASELSFDNGTTLQWNKISALAVVTAELGRSSAPSAELIIASDVARAVAQAADEALVDRDNSGVAGVKPASLTNGATAITSSGTDVSAIDADLRDMLDAFASAEIGLQSGVWLMNPHDATYLATVRGSGGSQAYPGVGPRGGTLLGMPVLTSTVLADVGSPGESFLCLVAADEVMLADDNVSQIAYSEQAALELDDAPSGGAQQLTSLWQHNLAGIRAERVIAWQARRSGACIVLDEIKW